MISPGRGGGWTGVEHRGQLTYLEENTSQDLNYRIFPPKLKIVSPGDLTGRTNAHVYKGFHS